MVSHHSDGFLGSGNDAFAPLPSKGMERGLFHGLCAVIEGPTTFLEVVRELSMREGLRIGFAVSPKTSFIISSAVEDFQDASRRADIIRSSKKLQQALKLGIPVVSLSFIEDSLLGGKVLSWKEYDLLQQPHSVAADDTSLSTSIAPPRKGLETTNARSKAVPDGWREARVFLSSTFRDMHGERDYLTRFVLPELQERCIKLQVHVTVVDLRWGVTEEESQSGFVLNKLKAVVHSL